MKKSKLESLIRNDIRKIVPNELPNVDLSSIRLPEVSNKPKQRQPLFVPILRVSAMLMSLTIVIVLALTFSNGFGQVTSTTTTTATNTDTASTVTTKLNPITEINAKEYALPIITASRLTTGLSVLSGSSLSFRLANEPLLMDDHIDLVNHYLNALETTLSFAQSVVTSLDSDKPEYSYLMQIASFNVLSEEYSYLMYYNVTSSDEDKRDIQGVLFWDDTESYFIGEYEVESDEQKLTIQAYSSLELEGDYIQTEYEIEDEEMSYQIDVYQDHELTSSSQIKIETEDSESKIEVQLSEGSDQIQFEIEKELEDEGFEIKVTYEITQNLVTESGEMDVKIVFDQMDNQYYYVYDVISGDITKTYQKDRITTTNPDLSYQRFVL